MYDDEIITRAAYSMITNHGPHAAEVAAKRASNLPGDTLKESREVWENILSAIYIIEGLVGSPTLPAPHVDNLRGSFPDGMNPSFGS